MGIGDIVGSVGKLGKASAELDPRKLVDLVNDLWGLRKTIVDTVEFVVENRAALVGAMGFVQDHADDLIDLAKRLPELLGTAGDALETAGGGAKEAGSFLLGDGTQSVLQLAEEAADALDRAHRELAAIKGLFDRAGAELVALPVVGTAARPIVDGAGRLGAVALDVGDVSDKLRKVGAAITDTGRGLDRVGGALTSSGSTLQRLRPAPAPPATKARATKKATSPATKKPSATTKAATTRAPAKKK
jgi:hypothetical protein